MIVNIEANSLDPDQTSSERLCLISMTIGTMFPLSWQYLDHLPEKKFQVLNLRLIFPVIALLSCPNNLLGYHKDPKILGHLKNTFMFLKMGQFHCFTMQ